MTLVMPISVGKEKIIHKVKRLTDCRMEIKICFSGENYE